MAHATIAKDSSRVGMEMKVWLTPAFEREREVDPDLSIGDSCAVACEQSVSEHSSWEE
jgi:hypothetical protein